MATVIDKAMLAEETPIRYYARCRNNNGQRGNRNMKILPAALGKYRRYTGVSRRQNSLSGNGMFIMNIFDLRIQLFI